MKTLTALVAGKYHSMKTCHCTRFRVRTQPISHYYNTFFRTAILKISYHLFLGLQNDCLTGGFPTKFYTTSVVSNHGDTLSTYNSINTTTLKLPCGLGNHKVRYVIGWPDTILLLLPTWPQNISLYKYSFVIFMASFLLNQRKRFIF